MSTSIDIENPINQIESKPQPQPHPSKMRSLVEAAIGLCLLAWTIVMTVLYAKQTSTPTSAIASMDTSDCLRTDVPPLVEEPAILLSTAQNALVYDYWKDNYFNSMLPPLGPQQAVAYPTESDGTDELKGLVAKMLRDTFGATLNPTNLFGVAGVTAALDSLFRILQNTSGDNNDAITATPYWPGFRWTSQQLKVNGALIPFAPADQVTHQITAEDIITTLDENPAARFLVICNPNNPLGVLYKKEHLEAIYSYILNERPAVHIISDEMYAHSVLPDHKSDFVSALALDAYKSASPEQKQHVHLVWGFAKDFGLNGFKVGWIYSTNSQVQATMNPVEGSGIEPLSFVATPISSLTSFYLTGLMQAKAPGNTDLPLYKTGMEHYAKKLEVSHEMTKKKLDELNVDYFDQNYAAQFFWLNLTQEAKLVGSEENLTALLLDAGVAFHAAAASSPYTIFSA
jgi:aspartate/methionine/tyrosine aminotransferase